PSAHDSTRGSRRRAARTRRWLYEKAETVLQSDGGDRPLALPGRWWWSRGRRRSSRYRDPLPRLRHSITVEDVLSVRVDHLALDQRRLGSRHWGLDGGPLIDDRRRGRGIGGIGGIGICIVRIGQRRSKSKAADEQPRSPPAASAAVMEATM